MPVPCLAWTLNSQHMARFNGIQLGGNKLIRLILRQHERTAFAATPGHCRIHHPVGFLIRQQPHRHAYGLKGKGKIGSPQGAIRLPGKIVEPQPHRKARQDNHAGNLLQRLLQPVQRVGRCIG